MLPSVAISLESHHRDPYLTLPSKSEYSMDLKQELYQVILQQLSWLDQQVIRNKSCAHGF